MNTDNLHELIDRYESNLEMLYGSVHDELFKWRALKTWQEQWFKPADHFASFSERFQAAKKDFDLLTDNSRMHPCSGVIKLWEKEPETVEWLFNKVLFAESNSTEQTQEHMDNFLDEYERLRQKYYPGNWSYKHDRHSASVLLAMNQPDVNYIFKSSEAMTMAKYTDFGLEIGSGAHFSLPNYYRLCEEIKEVLKTHKSLLDKHFERLTDHCYRDESLHLLVFDLMYCCRTYNFYKDLIAPVTKKTIRKGVKSTEEIAAQEAQRKAEIAALEDEIFQLEQVSSGCEDISLIGVEVTSKQYGTGTVIDQKINLIRVKFADVEKSFVLDKKFTARPTFENDDEIVTAFTEYAAAQEKLRMLYRRLETLR